MIKSASRLFGKITGLALGAMLLTSCIASSPVVQSPAPEAPVSEAPASSEESSAVAGQYITYGTYETSAADFSDTNVVLFFNAAWCSTCQVARENFDASLDHEHSFNFKTELAKSFAHGAKWRHVIVLQK